MSQRSSQETGARRQKRTLVFWLLASGFWLLASGFLIAADAGDTDLADSWATIPKGLGGIFGETGQWVEYVMTDSDAAGRQYIDLWLVPDAIIEFKAILRPNDPNKKYEADFPTSNGRRSFKVPSAATTFVMNWSDTPSPPTALKAYTDTGKVTLSWTAPSGDNSLDVVNGAGYHLYYDTGPAFDTWYLFRANDTIFGTTYTCTNVTNDSTYFFSLRSIDAYWDTGPIFSPYSDSIQVKPGQLNRVLFRVFVGEMNDSTVYLGYDTGGGWTERPLTREGTTKWWSDTLGLYRGFDFAYKFVMKDTTETKKFEFPVSSGRNHMFVYPSKSGVNSVTVKGSWNWGATTSMRLDKDGLWRADASISNGGVFEYGFSPNGTGWETDVYNRAIKNNNSVIGIDATINSSTMRQFVVPETETYTSTQDWEDTPYTPTEFLAMPVSNSTILLTWTAASLIDDLDTYRIEYSENPADTASWFFLANLPQDSTSYTHKNVIPGDTYYYRLYTVDFAANESQFKNYSYANSALQKEIFFLIRNDDPEPAMDYRRGERRLGLAMLVKRE